MGTDFAVIKGYDWLPRIASNRATQELLFSVIDDVPPAISMSLDEVDDFIERFKEETENVEDWEIKELQEFRDEIEKVTKEKGYAPNDELLVMVSY